MAAMCSCRESIPVKRPGFVYLHPDEIVYILESTNKNVEAGISVALSAHILIHER